MSYLDRLSKLISKEEFEKVKKDLGDKKLFVNDEEKYVNKEKLDAKIEEVKNLTEQVKTLKTGLADTEKKIKEFSGLETTNAELKTKLGELETVNKTLVSESDLKVKTANDESAKKINDTLLNSAITIEMVKFGAVADASQKSVKANIDMSKVTLEDGKAKGLTEQFTALNETSPALFFGKEESNNNSSNNNNSDEKTGTGYRKGETYSGSNNETAENKIANIYK